jgi:phage-related minor tail protein
MFSGGGGSTPFIIPEKSLVGGSYAMGGFPPKGKASLVGERGPELFVPKQLGRIIPNHQLGNISGENVTNVVTVNVDARGNSSVSGNDAQAKTLGALVAAAVQGSLIREKRAGGLLS